MSSPKNIQRDATFAEPGQALIPIATSAPATAPTVSCDGLIHYDYAKAQAGYSTVISVTAAEVGSFGVFIQQPHKDRQPYRVKANILVQDDTGQEHNAQFMLLIGYGTAPITTSGNVITDPIYIPFKNQLDDLIILEDVLSTDPKYGEPVYFGIAVLGPVTNAIYFGHISVQNLGVKPPTMQNAVC